MKTPKFRIGDPIVCKPGEWEIKTPNGLVSTAEFFPKPNHLYHVATINENGYIHVKEIPFVQNGVAIYWNQDAFEKLVEDKVAYRVVEVEVDKRVKEKRKEIIFNN